MKFSSRHFKIYSGLAAAAIVTSFAFTNVVVPSSPSNPPGRPSPTPARSPSPAPKSVSRDLKENLCVTKSWIKDTLISRNPFNPSPTSESLSYMDECCRKLGGRRGLFGCDFPDEVPVALPKPSRTPSAPDMGDKIIELASQLNMLNPGGDLIATALANYVVPMYVSEDCLVNCSGWQLIGSTVAFSAVTVTSAAVGAPHLIAAVGATGVPAGSVMAVEAALAAGAYVVNDGVIYLIGGLDKPPTLSGTGKAALFGAAGATVGNIIGHFAPKIIDRGKAVLKFFSKESDAIKAAQEFAAATAHPRPPVIGESADLPGILASPKSAFQAEQVTKNTITGYSGNESQIWRINGTEGSNGYIHFSVEPNGAGPGKEAIKIVALYGIKEQPGAGQFLREQLRQAYPDLPFTALLMDTNEKKMISALTANPVNPNFKSVPALANEKGVVDLKIEWYGGAPEFTYIAHPGQNSSWGNRAEVLASQEYQNWAESVSPGARKAIQTALAEMGGR